MNVDLDVYSRRSLQPLADAFGAKASQLYVGAVDRHYGAHFELASYAKSADALIIGFVRLITGLSRAGRQSWANAYRRDFNLGIQGGLKPRSFELALRPETLALMRRVNARLVITVYAAEPPPAPSVTIAAKKVPPNNRMQLTRSARGEAGSRRPRS
jgi:hypothetical protein